jgi:hypothetical protein
MKRLAAAVTVCVAPLTQSCSSSGSYESRQTTVTTTTPNESPPPGSTTTTTTTESSSSSEPDSVLGATVHAVGTVILFPFRLIGDALGLLL